MLSLLLTIIATACLFLAFKSFKVFGMNSLHAIIVNYLVCVIAGLIFLSADMHYLVESSSFKLWHFLGVALGFLFILTFLRMSRTAQEISVSASSMASKLALVIPVLFSLLIIQRSAKDYDFINYTGIVLTIPALLLASWPEKNLKQEKLMERIALPLSVFILSGIIDTCLNYFNALFEDDPSFIFFPVLVFFSAATFGFLYTLTNKSIPRKIKVKSVLGGIYLGIPNFFSLYFLLDTLKIFNQDGAFIFPFSNLGTIVLATLGAFILFQEKLNLIRLSGLILSCLALFLLAYQEFIYYFSNGT